MSGEAGLSRRAAVDGVGTALVMVVVGSVIQATRLTADVGLGLQLLATSTATVLGLGVLIALFGAGDVVMLHGTTLDGPHAFGDRGAPNRRRPRPAMGPGSL